MKILLGLLCVLSFSCSSPPPLKHKPPVVKVAPATVTTVPLFVDYVGHLEANVSVEVMAQVSGVLVGQHFEEGSDVKEGDLLLTIDPRPYEAELAKAHAALLQAEASLSFAEEKTERYAKLLEEDFVSKLDYDQYHTNVLTTQAELEQTAATLWTAQINLGYCYIRAPMNCTTGVLRVKPGNYIDANASVALTLLNQIQPILVKFSVPENDLLALQMAQKEHPIKVLVFPDAEKTQSFEGTLKLIDNQVNASTGAILCQATLQNAEKLLWPGLFVNVRVVLKEESQEMVIPTKAVMIGQGGHYVYVVEDSAHITMKPIKIGERYQESTIVQEGLHEHDLVVTEGQLHLYPGLEVSVTEVTDHE